MGVNLMEDRGHRDSGQGPVTKDASPHGGETCTFCITMLLLVSWEFIIGPYTKQ